MGAGADIDWISDAKTAAYERLLPEEVPAIIQHRLVQGNFVPQIIMLFL
ncbi:hypothetical protein IB238_06990 [Rhizobium sp. ARZ01]|nr:hypothetical protein [Rhizobium sp. ARZ01]MBD9372367.1 hypothetical protein [Rhizobium sp. ARZ01]